ncbi:hypothetical protein [Marinoscillum furvescens]|uniref:Uncharacterized protein n=1 Tax=Marinoscillum furvescens DSM 4134 TaxID=1122208 RepID=A0A3D9L3X5_MARFU|nr:hypothetical protein [Marinoscillum furvescens]RED98970.1 hypothetical protein C7460_109162 [Marinoscillum furvescens DSM 4134]
MKQQYIRLLNNQVEKLSAEDFDLEAWKSSTETVLTRIFGPEDPRIKQIQQLKIDYSSWALRDSNAGYQPIASCKSKGKELLITAIEELETFGVPTSQGQVLEEFFTASEIKILLSEPDQAKAIIRKLKKEDLQQLVLRLLTP